jgi:acyl-CoA dehydrogenase
MDETTFLDLARRFLDDNAVERVEVGLAWGEGDDRVGGRPERSPEQVAAAVDAAKRWKMLEFDAGFGWISGPVEYGGRGLSVGHERRYKELRAGYEIPDQSPFTISLGMVAPTILAHGSDEARDRYVRRLHRGELIGCQLFSEPGAGSDLASIATRAVRDGDDWIIDGQKVWTSGAHYTDIGEILCRTNSDAPKHRGMTAFVVDMKAPGVTIRPLRMMTGGSEFNEVFFEGVRVSDSRRLGPVDEGWRTALTTLMSERSLGAGRDVFGVERAVEMLRLAIRHFGLAHDPIVRQRFAEIYSMAETIGYNALRADERRRAGVPPGPLESIFKLANTNTLTAISALASHVIGAGMTADSGEWGRYSWARFALHTPGSRIAAGTDEIMKNILGERVLGLPKEPST